MEETIGRCAVCGATKELVHDMTNPYSVEGRRRPCVCFDCWRGTRWKDMKNWYLSSLAVLFVALLPVLTAIMLLLYILFFRNRPHWDDRSGLYLFLYFPTMFSVGAIPQAICQLWMMRRYGPRLELMRRWVRSVMELVPLALWGLTALLALLAFVLVSEGKIVMKW